MSLRIRRLVAFALRSRASNPTPPNDTRWAMLNWQTHMPMPVLGGLVPVLLVPVLLVPVLLVPVLLVPVLLVPVLLVPVLLGMGIGLTWPIFRRHISGQLDVDEHDDDETARSFHTDPPARARIGPKGLRRFSPAHR